MATGKRPPSSAGGPSAGRRRSRPAPTIDLQATEVPVEPVASAPAEAATPPPIEQPEPFIPPPPVHPTYAAYSPPPEEPPEPPPADPAKAEPDHPKRPASAWLPPEFPWPL